MTRQRVKVNRIEGKKTVVGLRFEVPKNDPRADRLFASIGKLLGEWLTPEEKAEFQRQLEVQRAKALGTSRKPVRRSAGRQIVQKQN